MSFPKTLTLKRGLENPSEKGSKSFKISRFFKVRSSRVISIHFFSSLSNLDTRRE